MGCNSPADDDSTIATGATTQAGASSKAEELARCVTIGVLTKAADPATESSEVYTRACKRDATAWDTALKACDSAQDPSKSSCRRAVRAKEQLDAVNSCSGHFSSETLTYSEAKVANERFFNITLQGPSGDAKGNVPGYFLKAEFPKNLPQTGKLNGHFMDEATTRALVGQLVSQSSDLPKDLSEVANTKIVNLNFGVDGFGEADSKSEIQLRPVFFSGLVTLKSDARPDIRSDVRVCNFNPAILRKLESMLSPE